MATDNSRRFSGFSLIELLIVVAIIGILAAIAVPNYLEARVRSKVSAAMAQIRTSIDALEMYRIDHHALPPTRFYCLALGAEKARNYFELPFELTTPIAYLSTRPIDPFNNFPGANSEGPGQTIKYRHPGFGYFNDMPTEEGIWVPKSFPIDDGNYIFYNNASEKNHSSKSPVEYGLWSVGPVPKIEIDTHTYDPVPSHCWYDPTNGTASVGIIVQLNTGHNSS